MKIPFSEEKSYRDDSGLRSTKGAEIVMPRTRASEETHMKGFTTRDENAVFRRVTHEQVFATANENGYFQRSYILANFYFKRSG
jgi:hypothetical protein